MIIDQNHYSEGLQIEQIGIAEPNANGPLGALSPSRFYPGQTATGFQVETATTLRFDQTGALNNDLFPDPNVQASIYKAAKIIAEYALDNEVADIIYLDTSARPIRVGVREYERLSGRPTTPAHFLSPRILVPAYAPEAPDEIGKQLVASHSTLLAKKELPILAIDACVHTGETLYYTKIALQQIGFTDIRTIAFSDDFEPQALTQSDEQILAEPSDIACRIFGTEFDLSADVTSIYAAVTKAKLGRTVGNGIRSEIRAIVAAGFAADARARRRIIGDRVASH